MDKTIWVTGAKGLVGTTLVSMLKDKCVGTGREIDIADLEQCRQFIEGKQISHIINCAAFSQVDPAESSKEEAHRANAIGPETLGRIAREMGARLLHLSTDYVFAGDRHTPLKERDPTGPCNFYGKTKLEGEQRLFLSCPSACILRTSWIFGQGGKNFIAKMFHELKTKNELSLVSDQTGRPTYAPDLCQVILQMLDHTGLYQFANSGETNKYEFTLALREEMQAQGLSVKCREIKPALLADFPSGAKRPLYSAFDTGKIERLLKITPRHWRVCLHEWVLHAK